uniref:LAGLIDADG endonuclease n=1 Tax=Pisolithus microcarpus TaxID=178872 RepID=A0A873QK38_9AGAM|nr:LAGLIDADG endonuclease [Pisolithus microcarpus]QPA36137.1 LAGLIDADG endonuclease [Pisolithus microcarpus]
MFIVPALNLAICWKLSEMTQSAGNFLDFNLIRILRDYTPEFICYNFLICVSLQERKVRNNHSVSNLYLSKNLGSYLAGFIEGNGTIIVPTKILSNKDKLNFPSIQIFFNLKDLPLALIIQKELGFGSLLRKKGVNGYILLINNYEELILLVNLIRHYLRTPKINSLNLLIDWFKNNNLNIRNVPLILNKDLLINDGWLSGFIEAKGQFLVRTTNKNISNTKYPKIECKFELIQGQKNHNGKSNLNYLENIADLLQTKVKAIKMNSPQSQFRVRTTNLNGNINLENYLKNYPLFSSKYLDYIDWQKVLEIFKKCEHKQKEGIDKIISIKQQMNDRRTIFSWIHLNNFYNLDK